MKNIRQIQENPLPETSIALNVTCPYDNRSHDDTSTDTHDKGPSESSALESKDMDSPDLQKVFDNLETSTSISNAKSADTIQESSLDFNAQTNDVSVLSGRSKTVAKHVKHLSLDNIGTIRVHDGVSYSARSPKNTSKASINRGLIDTTAPIESVKQAVSMFGGIVDWKAHRAQTVEKRKVIEQELEKRQSEIPSYKTKCKAIEDEKLGVLNELDNTKRIIEELNLNLTKLQTEEQQAKQDAELAALRVDEIELGIDDESSTASKARIEVANDRHKAAFSELKTVKNELEEVRKEYDLLVIEKDYVMKKAEEAVYGSNRAEKILEDLTNEAITAKEALEFAHSTHLEAEERRFSAAMAREHDVLNWEKEVKQVEEEMEDLNRNLLLAKDLKSKSDSATSLLNDLKGELTSYMEESKGKRELEEVKTNIEKETYDLDCLKMVAKSLNSELEKEKDKLSTIKQREGMASVVVSSLEAELDRVKSEINVVLTKVNEGRDKMVDFPKRLQVAVKEADQAKSVTKVARENLWKTKEEAEQAKAGVITLESKLIAAQKEIKAAMATKKLALSAINALQESESNEQDSPTRITLSFEEYYKLSKQAYDAEEEANKRVATAISQIEIAKRSESSNLNKLEELNRETSVKKAALQVALEKAEEAKKGKLGTEQELRKWRSDHEQRRKAVTNPSKSILNSVVHMKEPNNLYNGLSPRAHSNVSYTESESSPKVKVTKKKKRSFFPRFFMFFARKKSQAKSA